MLHNEEILIENIKKKGNKVLIWGACERNNDILDFFKRNDVNVVGYIDENVTEQETEYMSNINDLQLYNKDIINDNDYFVYVDLLKSFDEVISYLDDNNYSEFVDYWYPWHEIKLDGRCSYSDLYGNEYVGENYELDITLMNGGKLYIKNGCELSNVEIQVYDMSEVEIEDNVKIKGESEIRCKFQSKIHLGKKFYSECYVKIHAFFNSNININDNFRIHSNFKAIEFTRIVASRASSILIDSNMTSSNLNIVSIQNSKINVGKDCMFARDVVVRAGNSHNIFDFENGYNLTEKGYNVVICNHVWIGQRATLFNGCEIGSGSIVGINTFVNKKFPSNCSIAGNPARIIKENVAWRRESYPYFDSYEDFEEFDFR